MASAATGLESDEDATGAELVAVRAVFGWQRHPLVVGVEHQGADPSRHVFEARMMRHDDHRQPAVAGAGHRLICQRAG